MRGSEKDIASVVGEQLRGKHVDWDEAPEQGVFSRAGIIDRAQKIQTAVRDATGSPDYLGIDVAFEETTSFVNAAFDVYEGKKESERYDWVFAVPGRIEDAQDGQYASEVTPFLPILDPKYGVDDRTRQLTTVHLAPTVIETYKGREADVSQGAIVWTPLYVNASQRLDPNQWRQFVYENTAGIRSGVNDTARFVVRRLGAQVMGLGAIIPSFTQLGKTIHEPGLTTTTGHAGTVHLLNETLAAVIEEKGLRGRTIGLLGGGSIGSSWAELFMKEPTGFRMSVYDRDEGQIKRLLRAIDHNESIDVQTDELAVLRSADVIVSAINRTLDLDALEARYGSEVDLTGKVIIDDSQPGAFNREQVEARGGSLVWVVGQDISIAKTLHRQHGYNFGDTVGLYGQGAVWGCEAEAAAIFLQDERELAVRSHVTPDMVVAIGGLCREIGIEVARPLQSFGRPIDLATGFALGTSSL
jgi:hypothetical protein